MLRWFTADLTRLEIIIECVTLLLAILFYFLEYRSDKDKQRKRLKTINIGILASLKKEVELNWALLNHPPLLSRNHFHPQYYDPSRQIFKYRDDAIVLALSQVESDVLLDPELVQALLMVSYSIRFVNQQIDELMTYRFGSPERLAEASELVGKDRGLLDKFAADPDNIKPKRLRPYFKELALRHWAIVNKGYWDHLKPSLEALRQPLNRALQQAELEPVDMPVGQEVSQGDTKASITDIKLSSGSRSPQMLA